MPQCSMGLILKIQGQWSNLSCNLLDAFQSLLTSCRGYPAELCESILTKFRESSSKCSAVHPKIALWHTISDSHSQNLTGMSLHYSVHACSLLIPNNHPAVVFQILVFIKVVDKSVDIGVKVGEQPLVDVSLCPLFHTFDIIITQS